MSSGKRCTDELGKDLEWKELGQAIPGRAGKSKEVV
jgi:hypothetical protein